MLKDSVAFRERNFHRRNNVSSIPVGYMSDSFIVRSQPRHCSMHVLAGVDPTIWGTVSLNTAPGVRTAASRFERARERASVESTVKY